MRIGINISNGLHRRLKAIQEPINVSQVCRSAIEAIVEQHEQLAARIDEDNLGNIVDELAEEGEQWADIDWREYGWRDARDWFRKVDREQYEAFVYRREFYLREKRAPQELFWLVDMAIHIDGVRGFHDRMNEHKDLEEKEFDRLDQWGLDGYPRGDAEREYKPAWFAYFNAVHRLIENAKKQRAEERLRSRAKMPQPELPEHLV